MCDATCQFGYCAPTPVPTPTPSLSPAPTPSPTTLAPTTFGDSDACFNWWDLQVGHGACDIKCDNCEHFCETLYCPTCPQAGYCDEVCHYNACAPTAARSAIRSVEANVLETHLQDCVTDAMTKGDEAEAQEKIDEIKDLFKRYDEG